MAKILGGLLLGIALMMELGALAATPEPLAKQRVTTFSTPRGVAVPCPEGRHGDDLLIDAGHTHLIATRTCYMVSTGKRFVPWDSEEGQAIANEMAANLRSDGTLRHRQHHWPR